MGSLCLSSAPILRCESLNRVQVIALVIPTVFEATFSTAVIFVRRGTADRWVSYRIPLNIYPY